VTCGLALAGVVVVGCGGAETQDVLDPAASPGASTTSGGTTSGGTTSGGTTSGGTSGAVPDASTDASTACPEESEPNDGRDEASPLTRAMCGSLAPRSESDWVTFQLAPTSTSMRINYEGKVTVRVEVEGEPTVTLGEGSSVKVPFVKGKRYFAEVKAAERVEGVLRWRLDVIEN